MIDHNGKRKREKSILYRNAICCDDDQLVARLGFKVERPQQFHLAAPVHAKVRRTVGSQHEAHVLQTFTSWKIIRRNNDQET